MSSSDQIVSRYQVDGMSCAHCEAAVTAEVSALAGVTQVEVSAADGQLVVHSDAPVPADAVLAAVDEAGYAAAPAA